MKSLIFKFTIIVLIILLLLVLIRNIKEPFTTQSPLLIIHGLKDENECREAVKNYDNAKFTRFQTINGNGTCFLETATSGKCVTLIGIV